MKIILAFTFTKMPQFFLHFFCSQETWRRGVFIATLYEKIRNFVRRRRWIIKKNIKYVKNEMSLES